MNGNRALMRLLAALIMANTVGGCGFHLRQPAQVPQALQRIGLQLPDTDAGTALREPLTRQLQTVGIAVQDKPTPLEMGRRLLVTEIRPMRFLLNGQLTEVQLGLGVTFRLEDQNGQPISGDRTLWGRRTYQYDTATVNTENPQEQQLWSELYADLAAQLARQLQQGRLPAPPQP